MRSFLSPLAVVLTATTAFAQADAPKGNAATGKQLFADKGCYSCHGFVGQGRIIRAGGMALDMMAAALKKALWPVSVG